MQCKQINYNNTMPKPKVQESKSNRNNNQVTHKFLWFFLNVYVFIIVLSSSKLHISVIKKNYTFVHLTVCLWVWKVCRGGPPADVNCNRDYTPLQLFRSNPRLILKYAYNVVTTRASAEPSTFIGMSVFFCPWEL